MVTTILKFLKKCELNKCFLIKFIYLKKVSNSLYYAKYHSLGTEDSGGNKPDKNSCSQGAYVLVEETDK